MAPPSRKRKIAECDASDPADFLDAYFSDRNISGDLACSVARECETRAELARQRFKRARNAAEPCEEEDAASVEALTPAEKYQRRLVNNRRSAAASRVFREVLKKERAFALYNSDSIIADLRARIKAFELEVNTLRAENTSLQRHLDDAPGSTFRTPRDGSRFTTDLTFESPTLPASPKIVAHNCGWKPLGSGSKDANINCC